MAYIGNQGSVAGFVNQPSKQDLTGASGGTLTLTQAVSGPEDISLFINNVRQEPTTSYTVTGTTVTLQGYTVAASDDIYVLYNGLTQLSSVPVDGSVSDAKISAMSASKLTGALPAIDGSALTGVSAGKLLKHAVNIISTQTSRNSTTLGQIADFGSFTPSTSNSKIVVQGHAYFGIASSKYFGVRWVVDGVNYISTGSTYYKTFSQYNQNGYNTWVVPLLTEITNTDGSAITVTMDSSSNGTLYLNRSNNADNGTTAGGAGISAVAFYEIDNS